MRDHAAGFCVYNDCAVAISWLLDHGFERIAYVDVDVHHGDGVQAAFYDDPRVLTISLHQHPLTLWPGTGWPAEYGEGKAAGSRGEPGAAARHRRTRAGCARSTPWCRRCSARSGRSCWSPSAARTPTARTRWPTCALSVDGHRAIYRALRELADQHRRGRGSPSAAAGTGCSGWCRGRGRTCWPPCWTATSTRAGRCPPAGSRTPPGSPGGALPTAMIDGVGAGARAVDRGRRPGGRRGPRHPARGLPAARPGSRTTRGTDRRRLPVEQTGTERDEHDAWTRRSRWPRPPHRSRTTRGTGRPTSSPPTAASSTCARSLPDDADAIAGASTPGSPSAPATCATSARTRTSPRATWSGSPSSTTTPAWRWSALARRRDHRRRPLRGQLGHGRHRSGAARPRSRSSSATTTRAAGSARSCSSTSPPRPGSAGCAASRPRCWPRTARWCGCSATPATRSAASSTRACCTSSSTSTRPSSSMEVRDAREQRAEARSVHNLLHPRSVAVIGASTDPTKIGHAVLLQPAARQLRRPGLPGQPRGPVGARGARLPRRHRHPGRRRPRRGRRARRRGSTRSWTPASPRA